MTTGADGFAQFFVTGGEYKITATSAAGTKTWRWVEIQDFGTAATKDTGTAAGEVPLNSDLTAQFAAKAPIAWPTFSGNMILSDGNLTIGTSSKGISFAATGGSAAGSTSALLDDYEEGTWTPQLAFGGANVGMTYSKQIGHYTKIGNVVTAHCYVQLTSKGTSTGVASISGLPFTTNGTTNFHTTATFHASYVSNAGSLTTFVSPSGTSIALRQLSTAGVNSGLTDTNFANNSDAIITCVYRT